MAFIPISEEQFLKAAAPAAAAYDEEEEKKSKKKLYDELSQIKPETENITEYTPPTDTEIEEAAALQAEEKIGGQIEKYLSGAAAAEEKLLAKKSAAEDKVQSALEKAGENYQKDIKKADSSAIKKGIARSSIIEGIKDGIDKDYIKGVTAAEKGLLDIVDEIEKSLSALEGEKKAALDNFDLSKGLEIQKNIEKLQTERDKNIKAAEKESQAAQKNQADFLNDLKSPELKQRAEAVLKFYEGTDTAADLKDFANDKELKNYLGVYYDIVYSVLTTRNRNR